MLADSFEALIGAIYLDSSFKKIKGIIEKLWISKINLQVGSLNNPKSTLQEWCLKKKKNLPEYRIINKKGPDHKPIFKVQLSIKDFMDVNESGPSKQEAEIKAARKLISKLSINEFKN